MEPTNLEDRAPFHATAEIQVAEAAEQPANGALQIHRAAKPSQLTTGEANTQFESHPHPSPNLPAPCNSAIPAPPLEDYRELVAANDLLLSCAQHRTHIQY